VNSARRERRERMDGGPSSIDVADNEVAGVVLGVVTMVAAAAEPDGRDGWQV
jgi:hypothetical protein